MQVGGSTSSQASGTGALQAYGQATQAQRQSDAQQAAQAQAAQQASQAQPASDNNPIAGATVGSVINTSA
jgi:hypothetical protein